ncbi:hypothetical protein BT96DRAFT_999460 [Gymnopus androsaceus JB14]|uniref:DUF6532 domain-containing protein n=1 Tax=Gymnopus androsaceus JB14 TaxID=1447944 RepID=A0A6A4H6Q8_9AGAR|nr:hypothetical protein BT96DRAFT_999460 [Gymnopus androsaceus JB14]
MSSTRGTRSNPTAAGKTCLGKPATTTKGPAASKKQPTGHGKAKSRRNAGPPSSSPVRSSSPTAGPPPLSASEIKVLQILNKKKQEVQKKEQEAQRKAIQDQARALAMEEEESDNGEAEPAVDNPSMARSPPDIGDDNKNAAIFASTYGADIDQDNDEMNHQDPNHFAGGDAAAADSIDVDGIDNGISIDIDESPAPSTPTKKLLSTKHLCRHLTLNVSPLRTQGADFSPVTRSLAKAGKKNARCEATLVNAFPTNKHQHNIGILQKLALEDPSSPWYQSFQCLLNNTDVQKELVLFLGYACSGIFTGFTAAEVKEAVAWLSQDGRFKYGDVDVENHSYITKLLFGTEAISHLLHLEVFSSKGGANIEIFKEIVATGRVTGATIALMITTHALNKYSDGVHRHSEFSDAARPRYLFHLASYNKIAAATPTWVEQFEEEPQTQILYTKMITITGVVGCEEETFKLVLTQSNKAFLLDVQADDLSEVDLAGLEATAKAAVAPAPTTAVPVPAGIAPPVPATGTPAQPMFPLLGIWAAAVTTTTTGVPV